MRLRPGNSRDVATFTRHINAESQWLRGEDTWQEDELAAILISATGEPDDYEQVPRGQWRGSGSDPRAPQ
ncbi:MAG: hypothetical protein LH630_01180 [Actinomycetia bacterium]|nr:hypothetical protein [Actinomycetes bacterium]